jgi:hypothetical protein
MARIVRTRHDQEVHRRLSLVGALVIALAALALSPGYGSDRAALAATSILPDLAMVPPFDFRIETNGAGQKLLRFSTVVVNVGKGPFQLIGYDSDGATIGDTLSVRQQIKRSNGNWIERATTASMEWGTDGHNHWHVLAYQRFKLQNLDVETVGTGAKTGFCSLDSYHYGSKKPAFYTNDVDICQVGQSETVLMGTSRKWGDIYGWNLAFQWVDITGLPNGRYKLKVIADPPFASGGRFVESDESNNKGWARIRISGSTVTVLAKSAKP